VVHNRSGADSLLASQAVKGAEPDGYTLYLASSAHAINSSLFSNANYEAVNDFTPISMVADVPNVIVSSPQLPTETLAEFIAYAKARPGELNYATTASVTYLETAQMLRTAGLELERIPYKGAAPASLALMSGEVHLMVSGIGPMMPLIQSQKIRGLAVTSEQRSALLPDLPTANEAGLPGYTSSVWYVLLGPANLPERIVTRLNEETRAALAHAEVAESLSRQGVEVRATTPDELQQFLKEEEEKWGKIVTELGAQQN